MKTTTAALLALALGAAGLLSVQAFAADGEGGPSPKDTGKPVCEGQKKASCGAEESGGEKKCGDAEKCSDGDEACDEAGAECAKCVEGAKEGSSCCVAKKAAADLQVVTLSILNAEGEGWKGVVAAIPEAEAKRIEKERLDAWTGLVKVRRAIDAAKAECKSVCDEAKAAGKEASCEVTSAYENDVKEMAKKARGILDGLAAVVKEAVGADRVAALAEGVRKDGDVAKAVMEKVGAEAAKPVEPEKKEGAEEVPAPSKPVCGS
jgi:hypothetical protein